MSQYLLRRLLQTVPVLLGVVLIAFALSKVSGDPVRDMLGPRTSPEVVQKQREFYGLDKPLHEQFVNTLGRLLRGDLGYSMTNHGQPVSGLVGASLWVTFKLALGAILVATALGVTLGIVAAARPYGAIDYAASAFAAFGVSVPAFFLAMLLMLIFAIGLQWHQERFASSEHPGNRVFRGLIEACLRS